MKYLEETMFNVGDIVKLTDLGKGPSGLPPKMHTYAFRVLGKSTTLNFEWDLATINPDPGDSAIIKVYTKEIELVGHQIPFPFSYTQNQPTQGMPQQLQSQHQHNQMTQGIANSHGVNLPGSHGAFADAARYIAKQYILKEHYQAPKCECGCTAVGSSNHSDYCPLYSIA